jgi:ArsR family transcriptional regulator
MIKNDTTSPDRVARLLKAFADPARLRLLTLLSERREVCVCHLHDALMLPQPKVSRHLAYLRKHGLVDGRKAGLWVYYRLASPADPLHRQMIHALTAHLLDGEVARQDLERLDSLISCCDPPRDTPLHPS